MNRLTLLATAILITLQSGCFYATANLLRVGQRDLVVNNGIARTYQDGRAIIHGQLVLTRPGYGWHYANAVLLEKKEATILTCDATEFEKVDSLGPGSSQLNYGKWVEVNDSPDAKIEASGDLHFQATSYRWYHVPVICVFIVPSLAFDLATCIPQTMICFGEQDFPLLYR